ncbi:hypothetical protein [Cohnella sp. 56]
MKLSPPAVSQYSESVPAPWPAVLSASLLKTVVLVVKLGSLDS